MAAARGYIFAFGLVWDPARPHQNRHISLVGGKKVCNRYAILLVVLTSIGMPFWLAYAQTSQEVRVRWEVNIAAPLGAVLEPGQYRPDPMFTIVDRRQLSNPMPRQRSPELSADQLLVVAIDTQGQKKEQVLIP